MAITTIYTYPLTGSQREFTVPFEYLARRFVVLTLIGQDRKELVLATDFRFISKTIVQTTVAWGPADGYERIEIRRDTSATDRLVDFADGSILRASELNISQIQTLHVAEEARNMVADTIAENADGNLDARGRRLVNLADATEPDHAVTLRQEIAWADGALNSRNAAKVSEANSKASESAAKVSEANAKASEKASETARVAAYQSEYGAMIWAGNAEYHARGSQASANAAKVSEANSKAFEGAAKASEANSKASEEAAKGWASGVNMPSAQGQGGKILRQKPDGTGLEYFAKAGPGGGLDADTLDGLHAVNFVRGYSFTTTLWAGNYSPIFYMSPSSLASHVKFTVSGTSNGVVLNSTFELIAVHPGWYTGWSLGSAYAPVTLRIQVGVSGDLLVAVYIPTATANTLVNVVVEFPSDTPATFTTNPADWMPSPGFDGYTSSTRGFRTMGTTGLNEFDSIRAYGALTAQGVTSFTPVISPNAPVATCRFNGANGAIERATGNIGSVTRVSAGTYRVNFASQMPDLFYLPLASSNGGSIGIPNISYATTLEVETYTRDYVQLAVRAIAQAGTGAGGNNRVDTGWGALVVYP